MNNQYGQYNMFRQPERREPPRRKGAPVALVIVLALLFGFAGGFFANVVYRAEPVEAFVAAMLPYDKERPIPAGPLEATESPTLSPERAEAGIPGVSSSDPPASQSPPVFPPPSAIAEEVAAMAGPSVVEVTTEAMVTHAFFGSYITSGAGSGVILSPDGYIVTNHHVIEGSDSIMVRLTDGEEYPAELVGSDRQTDLAVIKIDAIGLTAVELADSDTVAVGQPVVAIGNPLGSLGGTVTEGIISAKDREIVIGEDEMTLLQTSAAINPGNSGGGLFDGEGLLVGVVNAKSAGEDIEGLGFAIPANTVGFVVRELRENGYVTGRPSLGIEIVLVNTRDALYYYGVGDYGVYVQSASGAEHPLRSGDRLLRVDEVDITGLTDLRSSIKDAAVGDSIAVVFQRGGTTLEAEVTLGEMPAE